MDHPTGNYQYVPMATDPRIVGGAPYSSGVRALPGYEIVNAVFQSPLPYREGFAAAASHLDTIGRPQSALCAVEVRVPRPLTVEEFASFNVDYRALLSEWGVVVDGQIPVARSNVALPGNASSDVHLYGVSYTVPAREASRSFFVSASPEQSTVRPGETTPDALREKVASAMQDIQSRLAALERDWSEVTALGIYTAHNLYPLLETDIIAALGPAAVHGVHWYFGAPPIVGIEIEIDVRSIRQTYRL
jgi:hypothetical protein